MKRNDVVKPKGSNDFFYGRIWRTLEDGRLVVICCGKHVKVYKPEELEVTNDYKGYTYNGKFYRMTSLKRLKLYASHYNPHFGPHWNAWGKRWTKEETNAALKTLGTDIWWADLIN